MAQKLAQTHQDEPGWWPRLAEQVKTLAEPLTAFPEARLAHLSEVAAQRISTLPQAFGHLDAAVGHTRTDGTRCGYRRGFLVDANPWIITAVVFVALNKPEAPTLITALDQYFALFARYPNAVGL